METRNRPILYSKDLILLLFYVSGLTKHLPTHINGRSCSRSSKRLLGHVWSFFWRPTKPADQSHYHQNNWWSQFCQQKQQEWLGNELSSIVSNSMKIFFLAFSFTMFKIWVVLSKIRRLFNRNVWAPSGCWWWETILD